MRVRERRHGPVRFVACAADDRVVRDVFVSRKRLWFEYRVGLLDLCNKPVSPPRHRFDEARFARRIAQCIPNL